MFKYLEGKKYHSIMVNIFNYVSQNQGVCEMDPKVLIEAQPETDTQKVSSNSMFMVKSFLTWPLARKSAFLVVFDEEYASLHQGRLPSADMKIYLCRNGCIG